MASAGAISIIRELGIRESGQSGSLALPGSGDHAAPYPSGCAKIGHHKANRVAYFSSHLFDAASIYRCRAEDHAGTAASFDNSGDARYVHAGGHSREAYRTSGRRHAIVPRKNTRNVGSAWTNSMMCTYFVPFCARAKIEDFR